MSEQTLLDVTVRHRAGALLLDISFALTAPWTVLFGPSGAGKSTVLRAIAGLLHPQAGRIAVQDGEGVHILSDAASGVFIPAHRRLVRFVGQQAALFPHRTVRENVAFGRSGARQSIEPVLELCRVAHVADQMPATISGGERQRVALARALGAMPARAVLLDEPFSGLDIQLRDELMRDIKAWTGARRVPVLHVTHDIGEAFVLSDEVIHIVGGRVAEHGGAKSVLRAAKLRLLRQLESDAPGSMP